MGPARQDQVKSSIQSLTTNKSAIQEMEEQQKQKISQVREQSQSLKSHVTSQFAELHQILVEKEQRILGEIKEDEEKILSPMEKNLQDIQENLNTIEEELSTLLGRMEQTDIVSFLKEEAVRKRRISDEFQTLSLRDGAILDEKFKHLFWLKAVLREPIVAIHQVSVTLDVETAGPGLKVSDDRKGVRRTGTWNRLPDTGKRFTARRLCWDRKDSQRGDITGRVRWRGVGDGVWESPQSLWRGKKRSH
ncbi:nuclear factor 7, ovary-like [Amblyraja radiata]|uniref:nuclear factor 7, ovary-like n=1 Tax=Amblyraja radiata TaxID=386614 RepID=UPI0014037014|nr:nuclear factor 7, ovary-like [Amblyraja radiata]